MVFNRSDEQSLPNVGKGRANLGADRCSTSGRNDYLKQMETPMLQDAGAGPRSHHPGIGAIWPRPGRYNDSTVGYVCKCDQNRDFP
jgi:hypothetical protein